ncbi:MAG: TonB-dependent receptor [Bacteroidota bacterium]
MEKYLQLIIRVVIVLLFLSFNSVFAQSTITGRVIDQDTNEPLAGVVVLIQGSTNGTVTDADGRYSLSVKSDDVLEFSFIGFVKQAIRVQSQTTIDIVMEQDVSSLEEVVVVGYVTKNRQDLTSAVSSADVENISKRATPNVAQALQGNVAGVNISYQDGSPGAPINLNIRGNATFGGGSGNAPLVIVDGVQIGGVQFNNFHNSNVEGETGLFGTVTTNGLENINPEDIESIDILKDASAAAIYGSRAANGVILITTKRGKFGKPVLNYNGYVGVQTAREGPDLANSTQYVEILQRMYGEDLDSDLVPQAALDYVADPTQFQDFDWYDRVHENAITHNHNLSVSGGSDIGSYRISAGYRYQDGVTLGTGYERGNVRANSDFYVSDKVSVGLSVALARSNTQIEPFGFARSVLWNAISLPPYVPFDAPYTAYYGGPNQNETNPLRFDQFFDQDMLTNNIATNLYLDYQIIEGLTYRISGSINSTEIQITSREKFLPEFGIGKSISESQTTDSNWNIDNTLQYTRSFGKHNIDLLAGFISQSFKVTTLSGSASQFISDITSTLDGPGGQLPAVGGGETQNRLQSYIGKASYNYDNRYLITFNFRRDGSSRFAPDVRWGNFPGVSAGWRISNEAFWPETVVNNLKLRGGYGVLGRQNIGDYDWVEVLQFTPVAINNSLQNGLITGNPVNRDISWEELKSINVGLDFGLFENTITGSFDYFEQETSGMILGIPIATSVGGGSILQNSGEITNNGVEISLNYGQKIANDFNLNVGVNATYTQTTFDRIGVEQFTEFDGSVIWDTPPVIQLFEGRRPSEFWLIETNGLFRTVEDVQNHTNSDGTVIQPNAQPGDIRFVDANDDGVIDDNDRQLMGSGLPDWNFGLNVNLAYKQFDFTLNLYGALGHYVMNGQQFQIEQNSHVANFSTNLLNAFDPVNNPNSNFPRLNPNDASENWNSRPTSDRYLEKGDFVKFANIEIGYRIPKSVLEKAGISNARIYVSTQNPFIITGYSGIDPEQGRDGFFNTGIDRGTAPQVVTFLTGINIDF